MYDQPPAPDMPRVQRFLECRMRVRGELKPNAGGLLLWNPNESARRTATKAAVDWCTDHGRRREAGLRVGVAPERLITPGEDPVDRLSEGEFQSTRSLWTAADGYLRGPGYAGRLPTTPGWTRHDPGADAVVLAHDAPQAWLEGQPDDATLARARADLEPILFDPNQSSP